MLERFYPILPDAQWFARLVPLGIGMAQLRFKGAQGRPPSDAIHAEIAQARDICAAHGCQLIVNDYWREAIALGVDFIHLGQEDLAGADLNAIGAAGLRFGISTHSEAELATALAAQPDYVALGPIYETKLKVMAWAPQGLERIGEWKRRAPCPVVAIGGITLGRAPTVLAAGADSIAVVTDIITHEKPEERVRAWLTQLG